MSNICSEIWSALSSLGKKPLPAPFEPRPPSTQQSQPEDLGHEGVDDDVRSGSTDAQQAGADAAQQGSATGAEDTVQPCPKCRVAIVVGHTSGSQGAYSETVGVAEWTYNDDIAKRTLGKIASKSGGKVEAKIFYRTAGGYSTAMARVYGEVKTFLETVPAPKRISIELHYNSSTSATPRYSEILHKGDVAFAQRGAAKLGAIFGGTNRARHYTSNERGQATFTNGPPNTYLMEPFFGSNPASAGIAATESGKDKLAEAYADMLVEWAR